MAGMKGKHHSEETRRKISLALKSKPPESEETRHKKSIAQKKRYESQEERDKISRAMKGKCKGRVLSEEHKHKISLKSRGRTLTDEWKAKLAIASTGRTHSEATRRKMSEANKGALNPNYGKPLTADWKAKISAALSGSNNPNYGGKYNTPEQRNKLSTSLKKCYQDQDARQRVADRTRNAWRDPDKRSNMLRGLKGRIFTTKGRAALSAGAIIRCQDPNEQLRLARISRKYKRPTSYEKQFIEFCNIHSLPFKYTGDGSFIIGGKNPDFVDINGKKVCVEVHCGYFDRLQGKTSGQYAIERKEFFRRYGWDCLIFMHEGSRKLNESEMRRALESAGYAIRDNSCN